MLAAMPLPVDNRTGPLPAWQSPRCASNVRAAAMCARYGSHGCALFLPQPATPGVAALQQRRALNGHAHFVVHRDSSDDLSGYLGDWGTKVMRFISIRTRNTYAMGGQGRGCSWPTKEEGSSSRSRVPWP